MTDGTMSYKAYLAGLPPERRDIVDRVWRMVRKSIKPGYTEHVGPKYLAFTADREWYVALANQKNYVSLHLMPMVCYPELRAKLDSCGKNLKMGQGCINFKQAEDLPLAIIAEIVGHCTASQYQAHVNRIRAGRSPSGKRR